DSSGALIPGVEVQAKNSSTGIISTTISNESGAYQFSSLQPGTYTLAAMLNGFETATYENVRLSQGQQVRLNFAMQVSGVRQAVEVLSDTATVLATTSASISDVLPENSVKALPLQTRNVLDLVALTGGTVGSNFAGASSNAVN